MDPHQLQKLIVAIPGVVVAVVYHEYAHGWLANRLGDPTAKAMGRLTLNPIAHIDIFGTILMPMILYLMGGFLFGYAKPVPVNAYNLNNPKRDMALVAAAGPVTNLLLVLVSVFLLKLDILLMGHLGRIGYFFLEPIKQMLVFCVFINVILAFFNLIPVPPLDGGRILVGILPARQAVMVARIEPFGIFLVMAVVLLDPLGLYSRGMGLIIQAMVQLLLKAAG